MTTPDSGWYPDPTDPTSIRWWSGTTWTTHALPVDAIVLPEACSVSVLTPVADALLAAALEPEEPGDDEWEPGEAASPEPVAAPVADADPALPPLVPDGPIRVAPAARVKRSMPRQVRPPVVESTAPIVVPAQGKVLDPNNLVAAPSSLTLLPAGEEPVPPSTPAPRRRRRHSKSE